MSGDVRIRRAGPDDYKILADIFRSSVREVASKDYSPAQIDAWIAAEPEWSIEESLVFAAEDAGKLIGFAEYELPNSVGMTYVHPRYIRQGTGRALVCAVEDEARRRGVAL